MTPRKPTLEEEPGEDLEEAIREAEEEFDEGLDDDGLDDADVGDEITKEVAVSDETIASEEAWEPATITIERDEILKYRKYGLPIAMIALEQDTGPTIVFAPFTDRLSKSFVKTLPVFSDTGMMMKSKVSGFIPMTVRGTWSVIANAGKMVTFHYNGAELEIHTGDGSSKDITYHVPDLEQATRVSNLYTMAKKMRRTGEMFHAFNTDLDKRIVLDNEFFTYTSQRCTAISAKNAFIVVGKKTSTFRALEEPDDLGKKRGGTHDVVIDTNAPEGDVIGFYIDGFKMLAKFAADHDNLTIHYTSNEYPYLVTAKDDDIVIMTSSAVPAVDENDTFDGEF